MTPRPLKLPAAHAVPRPAPALAIALSLLAGACNRSSTGSSPAADGSATPSALAPTGAPPAEAAPTAGYKVGMVLVGPYNDKGWNQAHYDGIREVLAKMPDVSFEYVDKVNPADRPNVKGSQVADDLISRGARLVVYNSDDYKDDALETARKHPLVTVLHVSGDTAWKEGKNYKSQANLGNIMGRIETAKHISGCAAALGTETGKIGYLGPLVNDETRRLVTAAYLGARHCWETYRKKKPEELTFKVTWIGFWFNIPGVTLDPTKVADDFYSSGFDVLLTGLDTPEAALQAKKASGAGKQVKYVHYDHKAGCDLAPEICLGVAYYNWTPLYRDAIEKSRAGKYTSEFVWQGPDFRDLNGEASVVGFVPGNALGERKAQLGAFVIELANGLELFKGPLKFQDGTEFLKDGEAATPQQIWYLPQLVKGITGPSK
ncbi:BMP family ABC transporter substrate-binding protein [Sorangium sp. So ce291]|uniref:BMP family lipoprotein n=1 Tax=Sorangium sp. So ce291 TaxID=3133294 RepID=UPI003F61F854